MAFGHNLKEEREFQGLTQKQLGELAGTQQETVSATERRDSKRSEYAQQLADALNVRIQYLLSGERPRLSDSARAGLGGEFYNFVNSFDCDVSPESVIHRFVGEYNSGKIKNIPGVRRITPLDIDESRSVTIRPLDRTEKPQATEPETPKNNFLKRLTDLYQEYDEMPENMQELIDEAVKQQAELRKLLHGAKKT